MSEATLVERRRKFCETFISSKEGRPYSLEGRSWVITEFWSPADGWKLWPNGKDLCNECRNLVGEIVEWTPQLHFSLREHQAKTQCAGLKLEPIMLILLNLPRRAGKTFNTAAYCLSTAFLLKNKSILWLASAQKQTKRIFDENLIWPVENQPKLKESAELYLDKIVIPRSKSKIEIVDTSHKSITGTGRTHIIIDEARDVDPRTASALIPSTRDQNGMECPRGHCQKPLNMDLVGHAKCVCGEYLVPWYGRLIIISSSGLLDGNENDWFQELVDSAEENPHPNVHLYRTQEVQNPSVTEKQSKFIEDVFGSLESLGSYIEVETSNVARRKGEDFVSNASIKSCKDDHLGQSEGAIEKCVGFLDTSLVGDTTSLTIVAEDKVKSHRPWEFVSLIRIDEWEPKKLKGGVIDPTVIQEHLDHYVPLFPGLVEILVDVRAMTWAKDLVLYNNRERRHWGMKIKPFNGGKEERNVGWNQLEYRILHNKISLPNHKRLFEELRAVRKVYGLDGSYEIRDRSRKKRHADVAEGVASCCFRIYQLQILPQQNLRQMNDPNMNEVLQRLYRPNVRNSKLTEDTF